MIGGGALSSFRAVQRGQAGWQLVHAGQVQAWGRRALHSPRGTQAPAVTRLQEAKGRGARGEGGCVGEQWGAGAAVPLARNTCDLKPCPRTVRLLGARHVEPC